MSSLREPSVEELREESERSREALAATASELRDRVGDTATELKTLLTPGHMKQKFKDSIREERDSFVKSLQRKVKENPLQLAAVGAAVAYLPSRREARLPLHDRGKRIGPAPLLDQCLPELRHQA